MVAKTTLYMNGPPLEFRKPVRTCADRSDKCAECTVQRFYDFQEAMIRCGDYAVKAIDTA
jgi:hypothetical protein